MDKKVERIIKLYSCLLEGKVIKKKEEAERFGVNQRTVQRDIDDIRMYLANDMTVNQQLVYDRNKKGYILIGDRENIVTSGDILTICKILLGSESLVKEEMLKIADKLIQCCVPFEEQKKISTLIANEKFHYTEPEHGKAMQPILWDFADAVHYQKMARVQYLEEHPPQRQERVICPVGILFSQGFFYITAYIHEDNVISEHEMGEPVMYRMDQIAEYQLLDTHFRLPYNKRLVERELRKRVDIENIADEKMKDSYKT